MLANGGNRSTLFTEGEFIFDRYAFILIPGELLPMTTTL